MTDSWSEDNIGDQTGRTFLVTGANSGIGLETARALAQHGATVLLGVRNLTKGADAAERIRRTGAPGAVATVHLDLADLSSVAAAAKAVTADHDRLDGLINNAGVMIPPYGRTVDGFETQFGVNHLGHFALTGHLMPQLLGTPGSRVVTVSSSGHRGGRINFEDLNAEDNYSPGAAYGQSKLANLLFAFELQRRLVASRRGLHRGGRAPRRCRDQPVPPTSRRHHFGAVGGKRTPAADRGAVGGSRRAAVAARGHRSGSQRRGVLRPRWHRGDSGCTGPRARGRVRLRRRRRSQALAGVRRPDRGELRVRLAPGRTRSTANPW